MTAENSMVYAARRHNNPGPGLMHCTGCWSEWHELDAPYCRNCEALFGAHNLFDAEPGESSDRPALDAPLSNAELAGILEEEGWAVVESDWRRLKLALLVAAKRLREVAE